MTIKNMLAKVILKRIDKQKCLFLYGEQVAVVVAGSMQIVSHETSISEPTVMALVDPGDIIGLAQIDNGVSVDPNCWIYACEQCDVFILSKDHLRYMWDQML